MQPPPKIGIEIGHVMVNGQKLPVMISPAWYSVFEPNRLIPFDPAIFDEVPLGPDQTAEKVELIIQWIKLFHQSAEAAGWFPRP